MYAVLVQETLFLHNQLEVVYSILLFSDFFHLAALVTWKSLENIVALTMEEVPLAVQLGLSL